MLRSHQNAASQQHQNVGQEPSVTPKLKPLAEQVIVIPGASSGIGLVTARMAAKAGAVQSTYASAKFALHGFTGSLRQEVESEVANLGFANPSRPDRYAV